MTTGTTSTTVDAWGRYWETQTSDIIPLSFAVTALLLTTILGLVLLVAYLKRAVSNA